MSLPFKAQRFVFGRLPGGFTPVYHRTGFQPGEKRRRIVAELDALQAESDALKHLQAESRRGLHSTLCTLMDPQVKIDTSLFILPAIAAERKPVIIDRG